MLLQLFLQLLHIVHMHLNMFFRWHCGSFPRSHMGFNSKFFVAYSANKNTWKHALNYNIFLNLHAWVLHVCIENVAKYPCIQLNQLRSDTEQPNVKHFWSIYDQRIWLDFEGISGTGANFGRSELHKHGH